MIESADSRPIQSDKAPERNGPSARPNRFCTSESTEQPVARTPGWTTSITIAETGPAVHVMRKPPIAIRANWVCGDSAIPNLGAPKAAASATKVATHRLAIATNLPSERLRPARSTMMPETMRPRRR